MAALSQLSYSPGCHEHRTTRPAVEPCCGRPRPGPRALTLRAHPRGMNSGTSSSFSPGASRLRRRVPLPPPIARPTGWSPRAARPPARPDPGARSCCRAPGARRAGDARRCCAARRRARVGCGRARSPSRTTSWVTAWASPTISRASARADRADVLRAGVGLGLACAQLLARCWRPDARPVRGRPRADATGLLAHGAQRQLGLGLGVVQHPYGLLLGRGERLSWPPRAASVSVCLVSSWASAWSAATDASASLRAFSAWARAACRTSGPPPRRPHAVLGGAVGLGDALARAGLGLLAQLCGRPFGRFDDARDVLGCGVQGGGGVHRSILDPRVASMSLAAALACGALSPMAEMVGNLSLRTEPAWAMIDSCMAIRARHRRAGGSDQPAHWPARGGHRRVCGRAEPGCDRSAGGVRGGPAA